MFVFQLLYLLNFCKLTVPGYDFQNPVMSDVGAPERKLVFVVHQALVVLSER